MIASETGKVEAVMAARVYITESSYGRNQNWLVDVDGRTERYRKLNGIGQGGFGQVLLTYDTWLKNNIALKISDNQASIRTEVQRLRSLPAQYFVRCFDYGERNSFSWYTMEILEEKDSWYCAKDFSEAMDEEHIGRQESFLFGLFIVKEMCFGLAELHSNKIENKSFFHGDIKPENFFFNAKAIKRWRDEIAGPQGPYVKIIDLGVSAEAGDVPVGGTEGYMPPEQVKGNECSASVDSFAVGKVLLELLTEEGTLSNGSPSKSEIKKLLESMMPTRLASETALVLATALHPDPNHRASCSAIAEELDDIFACYVMPEKWRLIRHMDQNADAETLRVPKQKLIENLLQDVKKLAGKVKNGPLVVKKANSIFTSAKTDGLIRTDGINWVTIA